MTTPAYRPSWWIVLCGLIAGLSLHRVLPALDHHAAEYSPFHGHVILGAASPEMHHALLAEHDHGAAQPHHHGPHEPAAQSGATVIGTSLLDGLLAVTASASDILARLGGPAVLLPLAVWITLRPAALLLLQPHSSPPRLPPRLR